MKIGIYPGSFNPFHLGHKNIVEKALAVFDHVIIAQGHNPEKHIPQFLFEVPFISRSRTEIFHYDGSLKNCVKLVQDKLPTDELFIVRGLRNGYDLAYEETLRKVVQDSCSIEFVYFFCDRQYEHISSSMIRQLQICNENVSKYLP